MDRTRWRLLALAVVFLSAAIAATSLRPPGPAAGSGPSGAGTGGGLAADSGRTRIFVGEGHFDTRVVDRAEPRWAIRGHDFDLADRIPLRDGALPAPGWDALDEELYRDNFEDAHSGWPVMDDDTYKTAYENGEYLWRVKEPGVIGSLGLQNLALDSIGLEVEVRVGSASDPAASGIYIEEPGSGDRLVFLVQPMASVYGLVRLDDQSAAWVFGPLLHTAIRGTGRNRIRLEREGESLRLMVNGQLLRTTAFPAGSISALGFSVYHGGQSGVADSFFDYFALESIDPTPTPGPSPTPTAPPSPTVRPTPRTGQAAFFDDFSDPATGWPVESSASRAYSYVDGEYRIFGRDTDRWVGAWNGPMLRNVTAEVTVRVPDDGGMLAALLVQVRSDGDELFAFVIQPGERAYALLRNTPAGWSRYLPWTESSVIRTDGGPNHLRIEQRESLAYLSINGVPVGSVPIPRMTGQGGLFVQNLDRTPGAEAHFDDFLIAGDLESAVPPATPSATPEYRYERYRNDFSDEEEQWCLQDTPNYRMTRSNGELHWWSRVYSMFLCGIKTWDPMMDVRVDVRVDRPEYQKEYSLLFGVKGEGPAHALMVNPTLGAYRVARLDFVRQDLGFIHAGRSDVIRRSGTNSLRVVSDGALISVIVNDVLLALVEDVVPAGGFGLTSANIDDPVGSDVYFDNLVVHLPGRPAAGHQVPIPPALPALPTAQPSPSGVPRQAPTPRPTMLVPSRAWLPLLARGLERQDIPPPVPAPEVQIVFGRGVDPGGQLVQPGTVFPADTHSLTGRIRYGQMPAGAVLRWEWWLDGERLEEPALLGRRSLPVPAGQFDAGIASNSLEPLPPGTYRLVVLLTASRQTWRGEARIEH